MIQLIPKALAALKAGQEIGNPRAWKKGQNLVNSCAVIITFGVAVLRYYWPDLLVSDEQIIEMASAAAIVLGLINQFITTASSKKMGVGGEQK